ncbi:DUF4097 family beta strand repeat-containing protein [Mesonia sp. K7]|uniref:DUF4097 family beta strand repeat-containing protein n=1 Tax=Mesonia sp. K7 TaxID=2218606 RepID=UPI000DA8FC7A|nr:DUF4097 family beta strand repeat-containing protein [Mesonia sp. K7]PZD78486.1 hypothetical protein DNG35_05335 [Mesonia sp. K7]
MIFLLISSLGFSQHIEKKQLNVSYFEEINLVFYQVFEVEIESVKNQQLTIELISEGEYQNQFQINFIEKGKTLTIESVYPEIYQSGYDKLSAHKVFSVKVKLRIPENKSVFLVSDIANVNSLGKLKYLSVNTFSGNCNLKNFTGKAAINTLRGNINIQTTEEKIWAETTNGNIYSDEPLLQGDQIKLKTIDGNIYINNTE